VVVVVVGGVEWVVLLSTLSLPTWVEVDLGCDNFRNVDVFNIMNNFVFKKSVLLSMLKKVMIFFILFYWNWLLFCFWSLYWQNLHIKDAGTRLFVCWVSVCLTKNPSLKLQFHLTSMTICYSELNECFVFSLSGSYEI
jgi:hypothetical protein